MSEPAKVARVSSPLGLDVRSLGLWRIALGLVLTLDWLVRSFSLREHYTSEGVLPLRLFLDTPATVGRMWSVFYLNDAPGFVALLFLLGLASALALMVGFRTPYSGWLAWLMLISIQHRNPLVATKGDAYLLLLIFWGNFLPWGRAFSLDATRSEEPSEVSVSPWAAAGYVGQICLLYWFSALLRTDPSWAVDGSALSRALHLETILKEPAYLLRGLGPDLLAFLTFATLVFEAFGPFLLLLPMAPARLLCVVAIMVFHLGIYASLDINNFAWICMVGPLGLLPAMVWNSRAGLWLEGVLSTGARRLARIVPGAWFGRTGPATAARWSRMFPTVALLVAVCSLWCDWKGLYTRSWPLRLAQASGIGQSWGMFSPSPPTVSGWQSTETHLASGKVMDLISETPLAQGGQFQGQRGWLDQRRRIYRSNLLNIHFGAHGQAYLNYLVGNWNQRHPEEPVEYAEYVWHSRTVESDEILPVATREVIARYRR